MKRARPPVHPGEILKEEFLVPLGLSANKLAKETGLDVTCIAAITRGDRGITAKTALALADYFKVSPEFWMNLQSRYDLEVEKAEKSKPRSAYPSGSGSRA